MPLLPRVADCEGYIDVWAADEPSCDTCGLKESDSPKRQLLSCASCLLAKYCTKLCQKNAWKYAGHRGDCHLFDADRKLSSHFFKTLGPGTIADDSLDEDKKFNEWNFLNVVNYFPIAFAALNYDVELATKFNVIIYVRAVTDHTRKHNNRIFYINKVSLSPKTVNQGLKFTGGERRISHDVPLFTVMANRDGNSPLAQVWGVGKSGDTTLGTKYILPPGYSLDRLIAHVNRGITHFHASFWRVPRGLTLEELKRTCRPTADFFAYALHSMTFLSGLRGQNVVGLRDRTGKETPLWKEGVNGHRRLAAPGETNDDVPEEFLKPLSNASPLVHAIFEIISSMNKASQACMIEFYVPSCVSRGTAYVILAVIHQMRHDGKPGRRY